MEKTMQKIGSGGERPLAWLRERVPALLETGGSNEVEFVARTVEELARAAVAGSAPEDEIRSWHEFVRAVAATLRRRAPEAATRLRSMADGLRRDALMSARNPVDQLALRPTSRRVLAALLRLGGADVPLADVRTSAQQGKTHFSNVLSLLRRGKLVTSTGDESDGRKALLSLTPAGRAAIAAATKGDADSHPPRIRVEGARSGASETFRPTIRQERPRNADAGRAEAGRAAEGAL